MRVASLATAGGGARAERIDCEERLLALARSRGSLRRALAAVAGQIVSTRSSERLGFARLADYARERVGLSARQVQDLAHVNERLATLPATDEALASGRLSWTKARLVARVATAEDEARWIAYARRVTTHELEREVRAIDRGSVEAGGLEVDEDGTLCRAPSSRCACGPRPRDRLGTGRAPLRARPSPGAAAATALPLRRPAQRSRGSSASASRRAMRAERAAIGKSARCAQSNMT